MTRPEFARRRPATAACALGLALVLFTAVTAAARACPVCKTGTGERVRQGIAGQMTAGILGVTAPLLLLAALSLAIHHRPPRPDWRTRDARSS